MRPCSCSMRIAACSAALAAANAAAVVRLRCSHRRCRHHCASSCCCCVPVTAPVLHRSSRCWRDGCASAVADSAAWRRVCNNSSTSSCTTSTMMTMTSVARCRCAQSCVQSSRRWLHGSTSRHQHNNAVELVQSAAEPRITHAHVDTTAASSVAAAAAASTTTATTATATAAASSSPSLSRDAVLRYRVMVLNEDVSEPPQQRQQQQAARHGDTASTMHKRSNNTKSKGDDDGDDEDDDDDDLVQGSTSYRWRTIDAHRGTRTLAAVRPDNALAHYAQHFAMPRGYPDTTAPGYRHFFFVSQLSAFLANFATSIGTQTLLSGFFVGATAQLWMLKDLVPALLAAYLANRVVSYEARPKHWFVVSVLLTHATVIADMLIPQLVPHHVLAAAIAAATVKQSAALMYFVTRASALQHFSLQHNNLAELTKKFNSFGVVNFTVATALGIAFCGYCTASFAAQLAAVVVCCAANVLVAPLAMHAIHFRVLNATTMSLLLRRYLAARVVLTPADVSRALGVRMLPPHTHDIVRRSSSSDGSSSSSKTTMTTTAAAAADAVVVYTDVEQLLCVGPPMRRLRIRSDELSRDVLYVCRRGSFVLALWHVTSRRRCSVLARRRGCSDDAADEKSGDGCTSGRVVSRVRRRLCARMAAPLRWLVSRLRHSCARGANVSSATPDTHTTNAATTAATSPPLPRPRRVRTVFGTRRLVLLVHHDCTPLDLVTAHLIMYTAVLQHATSEAALRSFVRRCHGEQAVWERRAAALRSALRHADWDVDRPALDHPGHRVSSLAVFARAVTTAAASSSSSSIPATQTTATTTSASTAATTAKRTACDARGATRPTSDATAHDKDTV